MNKNFKMLFAVVLVFLLIFIIAFVVMLKSKTIEADDIVTDITTTVVSVTEQKENIGVVDISDAVKDIPVEADIEVEQFLNTNLADFTDMMNIVGYLQVPDTYIDFPVVQYFDNETYLNKGYYFEDSEAGAPFVDYRNNVDILDFNNIIYGHNMADGSMFGTLQYLTSKKFDNTNNNIYLNTIGYKNIFKIYSIYDIDLTTFNFIQTKFVEDSEKQAFINQTIALNQNESLNAFEISTYTKILTLVTCTQNGAHRLVVHAYLYDRIVY